MNGRPFVLWRRRHADGEVRIDRRIEEDGGGRALRGLARRPLRRPRGADPVLVPERELRDLSHRGDRGRGRPLAARGRGARRARRHRRGGAALPTLLSGEGEARPGPHHRSRAKRLLKASQTRARLVRAQCRSRCARDFAARLDRRVTWSARTASFRGRGRRKKHGRKWPRSCI